MKSLNLILVAGALPLLIATGYSFTASADPIEPDPVGATDPPDKVDYAPLLARASEQRQDVEKHALPVLAKFQTMDLFGPEAAEEDSALEFPDGSHAQRWLRETQETWPKARATHVGIIGVLDAQGEDTEDATGSDERKTQLQSRFDKLEPWSSEARSNPLDDVRGGSRFVAHIDDLRQQLKKQIANEDLLAAATGIYRQPDFAGCLAELAKIQRGGLSPDTPQLKEADALQRRAVFWKHWETEPPVTDKSQAAMDSRINLRDSSPEAVEDKEIAHLRKMDTMLAKARCERTIKSLDSQPPERLDDFLQLAETVIATCPDERGRVESALRRWFEEMIPVRVEPGNGLVAEAIEANNGPLKVGIFEKQLGIRKEDKGKLIGYQFWETQENRRAKPLDSDIYYPLSRLAEGPRDPMIIVCVKRFNDGRKELLGRLDSRQSWMKFQMLCGELNDELTKYMAGTGWKAFEQAIGKDVVNTEFGTSRGLADRVVDEWSRVNSIFGE